MKKHILFLVIALSCTHFAQSHPISVEKAKKTGQSFIASNFNNQSKVQDLSLVYTGVSNRNEPCFYVFNEGNEGFVIVSADDQFRPIVGYSDEGPFHTENMSPELAFYLDRIIEARTSGNAIVFEDTEREWQSVATTGKLLSRNGGRGVDVICSTRWNQDSPYNLYAPEATSGPGGRCYAGCVATAMSQVMKYWDHPTQGTGSHSYYCYGYGTQSANFGNTIYDWKNMPDRLNGASSQEEIEAVALLMYHCGVAVDMGFAPDGSGANSWDVPYAIRHYFSYANQATLRGRDEYSLSEWQNMLKESFDLGWPVYYSGYNNSGGHAFVCDGYDDNDLFHFNWGWGGSSDGWFVIDEIDYAGWAQAVFNFVPTDVYNYMPMQPENLEVISHGDSDFSATINWTNPTQNIHLNNLDIIDQIVVTRNGKIIYTENNVTPGANMTYTDHYMPTMVSYAVYAIVNNAKGIESREDNVFLGPTCNWTIEMESSETTGWAGAYISMYNTAGVELCQLTTNGASSNHTFAMPQGHVNLFWKKPEQNIESIRFTIKNNEGETVTSFEGPTSELHNGLIFVINNTCDEGTKPMAPENLRAQQAGNAIVLQWDAPQGSVDKYCIYRDRILYDISESTSFTDEAANDSYHNYYVTALQNANESDPSNICNINLDSPCSIPTNLRYEIANNKVKLMWEAPEGENPTGYFLYRRVRGQDFSRIKALTSTYYSDNILGSQNNEIYEYAVAAYYREGDCTSGYANSYEHPELYFLEVNKTIIPQHLSYTLSDGSVILRWEQAIMAESYNIYRNGELIAQNVTETTFTDNTVAALEDCRYMVTGITAFVESNPSNEVVIDWTALVEEGISESLLLYPNPTSGIVKVNAESLQQIILFDLTGREVMHKESHESQTSVDLSALPQGTYIMKVVTDNGSCVKRVIKF